METLVRNGRIRIYAPDALNYNRLLLSWRASSDSRIVINEHYNDKSLVHPKVLKFWYSSSGGNLPPYMCLRDLLQTLVA